MNRFNQKVDEFIKLNPETKKGQFILRENGVTIEWICKCGVGHPIQGGVHGCCGCCEGQKLV